jgi:hypothetical protein
VKEIVYDVKWLWKIQLIGAHQAVVRHSLQAGLQLQVSVSVIPHRDKQTDKYMPH